MKLTWIIKLSTACALIGAIVVGCKKDTSVKTPPEIANFTNQTGGTYFITAPGVKYKIPVGFTTVSDKDRTINISVTSPTGAVAGTHYTLSSSTITIPAGKAVDTLVVTGNYASYSSGRKDSLIFKITDSKGVATNQYNSVYTLFMRGPCFDGDITDINVMSGTYSNATDPDDPVYTVTVSSFTMTGAKTATATIGNLWDWFGPVNINFDWTDPNNTIVTIPRQTTNRNYAAGQPFSIRTSPGVTSKFSVCSGRISLIVDLIVENYPTPGSAAFYEQQYPMTIIR